MIIGSDNKADAATLAASSEQASLPGSNVQQPHVSRKWYTAAGVTAAALTLDLLSPLTCGVLALIGTNLAAAGTLRLRASDTDATAVAGDLLDTGTFVAGVDTRYGNAFKVFSDVTARYWRVDLDDAAAVGGLLKAGRLFLGPKWSPADGQDYGWGIAVEDVSRMARSYGGQRHDEILPKFRRMQFMLSWITDAEAHSQALALAVDQGVTGDVLVIPRETGSYNASEGIWGRIEAQAPIYHRLPGYWTQKFTIEERL